MLFIAVLSDRIVQGSRTRRQPHRPIEDRLLMQEYERTHEETDKVLTSRPPQPLAILRFLASPFRRLLPLDIVSKMLMVWKADVKNGGKLLKFHHLLPFFSTSILAHQIRHVGKECQERIGSKSCCHQDQKLALIARISSGAEVKFQILKKIGT